MAGENEPKTYTQEQLDAEVAGLKANKAEALKEAKEAKARLAAYDGVDAEEFKRLKAAAVDAEQKKAVAEGNFDALKKQLVDQHAKEREGDAKRMGKLETSLSKRLKQDELRRALTGKATPEMMDLLIEHGTKFLALRETDDDFEQYVTDGKGNARVSDGSGTPMSIDAFVDQDLKTRFPGAFLGSGSSGGGATKSTAGGAGVQKSITLNSPKDFMDNVDAIAANKVTVVR